MAEPKAMEPVGSILEQTKQFMEKMQGEPTTGSYLQSGPRRCRLCESERETWSAYCSPCDAAVIWANGFVEAHLVIPKRYAEAKVGMKYDAGKSYLLHGPAGTGKTHTAYALLRLYREQDRRLTLAAYSWPAVLLELRRSYSAETQTASGMIEALRKADVALLDDLGAERITESNRDWVRETLFVILDERWAEMRTTILTTNIPLEDLPQYLGDRIVSRILGMCELREIAGGDRRLWVK